MVQYSRMILWLVGGGGSGGRTRKVKTMKVGSRGSGRRNSVPEGFDSW